MLDVRCLDVLIALKQEFDFERSEDEAADKYGAIVDDDFSADSYSPSSPSLGEGPSTSGLRQDAAAGQKETTLTHSDGEESSDLEIVEVKGIPSTGKCPELDYTISSEDEVEEVNVPPNNPFKW